MLRIVKVDEKYITKLREIDNRVYKNKNEKRPYVGFLIDIDGSKYVAPLTSPKPKHSEWNHKKKDIFLIDKGKKGALQLSNMIPVKDSVYYEIKLDKNNKYHELLKSQAINIDNNKNTVKKRAERLLFLNKKNPQHYELRNCCDFESLKQVCDKF